MTLLTSENVQMLWQETIQMAENRCSISLDKELESYLASLLMRYTNQTELAKQVLATAYLDAQQKQLSERKVCLQAVADQCLLFAGLFPRSAIRKRVKVSYFVDLGRSAYIAISYAANDLFHTLAFRFVPIMDVLHSMRPASELLPLEAYELWQDVGSQHALIVLQSYTQGTPIKTTRR